MHLFAFLARIYAPLYCSFAMKKPRRRRGFFIAARLRTLPMLLLGGSF